MAGCAYLIEVGPKLVECTITTSWSPFSREVVSFEVVDYLEAGPGLGGSTSSTIATLDTSPVPSMTPVGSNYRGGFQSLPSSALDAFVPCSIAQTPSS